MTQVAYDKSSPWANTPQVSKNQINYLDFWPGVVIDKTPSDKLIQLSKKYEHRPDLLSNDIFYRKYNAVQLQVCYITELL